MQPIRRTLPILVLTAVACAHARAQQDFSKVEMKTTHVAGNVYMLEGAGGNIGVSAGPDGLLIVDDEFLPLAPKIEAALAKINPGKLKFVLNTHFHGDHTGSNAHFGRQAPIIAHTNARKRLGRSATTTKDALPVVTFDDSLSVHFNGEEIKVLHVPSGHTDSDCLIFFTKSNVVHMGDQFFCGRYPNIDLGGGGDVRGYIRNVEQAIEKIPADAKIIPGHGPLAGIEELKQFREMLVATSDFVAKEIAAGKTLQQVKDGGLPARWKEWDKVPMGEAQWIEILYRGLSRKPDAPAASPRTDAGDRK
jgi:glyoxylase-like metal-dependent hydrolase (beta-lactamase superfamily II)